jgi:hypothetical protein
MWGRYPRWLVGWFKKGAIYLPSESVGHLIDRILRLARVFPRDLILSHINHVRIYRKSFNIILQFKLDRIHGNEQENCISF